MTFHGTFLMRSLLSIVRMRLHIHVQVHHNLYQRLLIAATISLVADKALLLLFILQIKGKTSRLDIFLRIQCPFLTSPKKDSLHTAYCLLSCLHVTRIHACICLIYTDVYQSLILCCICISGWLCGSTVSLWSCV